MNPMFTVWMFLIKDEYMSMYIYVDMLANLIFSDLALCTLQQGSEMSKDWTN